MLGKPRILSFFPHSFNKFNKKHEHSCKILYINSCLQTNALIDFFIPQSIRRNLCDQVNNTVATILNYLPIDCMPQAKTVLIGHYWNTQPIGNRLLNCTGCGVTDIKKEACFFLNAKRGFSH